MDQTDNNKSVDFTIYQLLIGKLIYLTCRSWPNISFVVKLLSQYNSELRVVYFCITKQVFYYLKKTIDIEIV